MTGIGLHVGAIWSGASRKLHLGFRSLVGLPVLLAFGLGTMPARALPAASVQLFRINGNGVKPMPGITDALDRAQDQRNAVAQAPQALQAANSPLMLVAQSDAAAVSALSSYSQTFTGPLPLNLAGKLRIVAIDPNTGTIGRVLEEINVNSPNITISPDRLQITIRPQVGTVIRPGDTVMVQFPSVTPTGNPIVYPNHLASTPCQFTATAVSAVLPVAPLPVVAAAAAPAAISPLLIIGAALLVGVGVAAAVGAFSSNSGGGTNPSSQ